MTNSEDKIFGWKKTRLKSDFSAGWFGIICFLLGLIVLAVCRIDTAWLGVGAGSCAMLAILSKFREYFIPSPPGTEIKAANIYLSWSAGMLAIFSSGLWILDAWPPDG